MAEDFDNDGAADGQHDRGSGEPRPAPRSGAAAEAKLVQVSGSGLSGPFIRRPVMTVLLTLSAIVAGLATYGKLAVNDLPAVDYPVINVTCSYPGANPTTMANNIATPLEKQFLKFPVSTSSPARARKETPVSPSSLVLAKVLSTRRRMCRLRSSALPANCRSICPAHRRSPKPIRTIRRFI